MMSTQLSLSHTPYHREREKGGGGKKPAKSLIVDEVHLGLHLNYDEHEKPMSLFPNNHF